MMQIDGLIKQYSVICLTYKIKQSKNSNQLHFTIDCPLIYKLLFGWISG